MAYPGIISQPSRGGDAAGRILGSVHAAAQGSGVDGRFLEAVARVESSLNPAARATGSSAAGLFQFTEQTWLGLMERHGDGQAGRSRAETLALRHDAETASRIAAEHTRENAEALQRSMGREADGTEVYLAHFLGLRGATQFIRARAADGSQPAAAVFPAAAAANGSVFYDPSGAPRSLDEVASFFARKLGQASAAAPALRSDPSVVMAAAAKASDPTSHATAQASLAALDSAVGLRADPPPIPHDIVVAALLALDINWIARRPADVTT
jgi:hypothetical protein